MVQLTGAYRKFCGPHPFEAGAKSGSLKVIAKLTLKGDNGAIVILTTGSSWVWRYLTIANDTGEGASYGRGKEDENIKAMSLMKMYVEGQRCVEITIKYRIGGREKKDFE